MKKATATSQGSSPLMEAGAAPGEAVVGEAIDEFRRLSRDP